MGNKTEAIIQELIISLIILGAKSDLLSTICSYGDTLEDEEVLEMLRDWNRAKAQNIDDAETLSLLECAGVGRF